VINEEIREDASCFKADGKGCGVGSDVPNIYKQYPSFLGIIAQIISKIWIIKKERFCPGEHTDLVVCSYSMYGSLGAFGK